MNNKLEFDDSRHQSISLLLMNNLFLFIIPVDWSANPVERKKTVKHSINNEVLWALVAHSMPDLSNISFL
jgi:hypothetical protein